MAKKKEIAKGIERFFTALVYEASYGNADESRDVYQADVPSIYAEARLGVASKKEIETELNKLTDSVNSGNHKGDMPFFTHWLIENKGVLGVSDLEDAVSKANKSAALIRESAVESATQSELGTLTSRVKGRTSGVDKDTLKFWDVEMSNYALVNEGFDMNPAFRRNCQCGFKGKHTNKRSLWDQKQDNERRFLDDLVRHNLTTHKEVGRELHIACYHEAALATAVELQSRGGRVISPDIEKPTTIAFDFTDRWDLVFEAFARRYKYGQLYGDIDEFLFRHDVVTPYFKALIAEGKVNKEVIKKSRHFDYRAKDVMMGLHRMLLKNGFRYAGFANEFQDVSNRRKSYSTVAVVYESPRRDTSYHIVYDRNFWMPFVVKKDFVHFKKEQKPSKYQINPLNILYNSRRKYPLYLMDDRTQRVAKITMIEPDTIAEEAGVKREYEEYRRRFLAVQKR